MCDCERFFIALSQENNELTTNEADPQNFKFVVLRNIVLLECIKIWCN